MRRAAPLLATRAASPSCIVSRFSTASPVAAPPTYDVLVVGGGVVGALFAALLRAHPTTRGLSVAVADPSPLDGAAALAALHPLAPLPRCSTLTPASAALLREAGAWLPLVATARVGRFGTMRVADGAPTGCGVRYTASDAPDTVAFPPGEEAALGLVVEDAVLRACLASVLRADPGVTLLPRTTLSSLSLPPRRGGVATGGGLGDVWACAELHSASAEQRGASADTTATARLVVAADGADSRVRSLVGARSVGWRYDSSAVVGVVSADARDTAWQVFVPGVGPLAVLPSFAPGLASVVWSAPTAVAASLAAESDDGFASRVDEALSFAQHAADAPSSSPSARAGEWLRSVGVDAPGCSAWGGDNRDAPADATPPRVAAAPPPLSRLYAAAMGVGAYPLDGPGGGVRPSLRPCFPLSFSASPPTSSTRQRLVLLGDASLRVHPLAGQGLNIGMGHAGRLAGAVAHAVSSGSDVGDTDALGRAHASPLSMAGAGSAAVMAGGLDVLARLFGAAGGRGGGGSAGAAVAAARGIGMAVVNASPALRRAVVGFASGGGGGGLE